MRALQIYHFYLEEMKEGKSSILKRSEGRFCNNRINLFHFMPIKEIDIADKGNSLKRPIKTNSFIHSFIYLFKVGIYIVLQK